MTQQRTQPEPPKCPASTPTTASGTSVDPEASWTRLQLTDLAPGAAIAGAAVIRAIRQQTTSAAKPYLQVTLANASGAIESRVWTERLDAWSQLSRGTPVSVEGVVKPGYRAGPPELDVRSVAALPDDHPVRDELNPRCPIPRPQLEARLARLLSLLRPGARALVEAVLEHVGYDRWWRAPAAKAFHDASLGGLAHHSIKVAEAALALAWASDAAQHVWLDAVVVGGLLHDVGKVEEYVWEATAIDVSRRFYITSHVCSGVQLVHAAVAAARESLCAAGLTTCDIEHLEHVIVSHHGQPEWGAPVAPVSLEATLVHHADNACAKTAAVAEDLAICAVDREGWAEPPGWRKRPVWVAHAAAIRGDRLVSEHIGDAAIRHGLRVLLDGAGSNDRDRESVPTTHADDGGVVVPRLTVAEAAGLVHTVWQGAFSWSEDRRAKRAGLLDVADAVARQLPICERARLEGFRPVRTAETADIARDSVIAPATPAAESSEAPTSLRPAA